MTNNQCEHGYRIQLPDKCNAVAVFESTVMQPFRLCALHRRRFVEQGFEAIDASNNLPCDWPTDGLAGLKLCPTCHVKGKES